MNTGETIELADLVSLASFEAALDEVQAAASVEDSGRLRRALGGLAAPRIAAAVGQKFRELDLLVLFIRGWGQAPAMTEAALKSAASHGPRFVRLASLEQNIELFPIIGVSAWGLKALPIQFTLSIQGQFEAVEVGLDRGYVTQIAGGFVRLSALLNFGKCTFPAGIAPKEWQFVKVRRFENPGVSLLGPEHPKPAD